MLTMFFVGLYSAALFDVTSSAAKPCSRAKNTPASVGDHQLDGERQTKLMPRAFNICFGCIDFFRRI
jgi:hypothetical protein